MSCANYSRSRGDCHGYHQHAGATLGRAPGHDRSRPRAGRADDDAQRARPAHQRPADGVHADLAPSPLREHLARRPPPVLLARPPRGGAAHPQGARRLREGQRAEHDPHRRRPRRGRPRRARRRPGRRATGDPVAHPRRPPHHPRHPSASRPVVRRAAREAHRRRAGGAGPGHGAAGTGGRRVSPTFSSLQVRNYRLWASGALVSNIGTWMGRVGQDWLVLTEGSATALGVVTGLQFLPFLLLAPWAGLIADQFRKRRILLLTQTLLAVSSLLLGVLAVAGLAQLWQVYAIALL